jgi:hypothetical protein
LGSGDSDWNYRISAQRSILIKTKNENLRKILATDVASTFPLTFEVAENVSIDSLDAEKEYLATFKVYSLGDVTGVEQKYVEFFEVLDVDQTFEDFVTIYGIYPNHIKFVLSEVESI